MTSSICSLTVLNTIRAALGKVQLNINLIEAVCRQLRVVAADVSENFRVTGSYVSDAIFVACQQGGSKNTCQKPVVAPPVD
jgi:hypothetical protein